MAQQILDLTGGFIEEARDKNDREAYEALYPALFEHYFRYWCPRDAAYSTLSEIEIRSRALRIAKAFHHLAFDFASIGIDTGPLQRVAFVGGNTSNGHAFQDGDAMVVWVAVESYTTEMLARVFVAHELIHGLHFLMSPNFYFQDELSKNHFGRQLITEGVATYLTAEILGVSDEVALWADYLSPSGAESWMEECRSRLPELYEYCRQSFSESSTDVEFFMANDPDNIMKYRAGYFVGLHLIREITAQRNLSAEALLSLPREVLEAQVLENLGSS